MRTRYHVICLVLCVAAVVLAGCGTSRGPVADGPPTVEISGVYQFEFQDDGASVSGTATITGAPGAETGIVHFDDGRPEVPISSAAASGNLVIVTADIPGAVLVLRLRFNGESFAGDWVMGRDAGPIAGTRSGTER